MIDISVKTNNIGPPVLTNKILFELSFPSRLADRMTGAGESVSK